MADNSNDRLLRGTRALLVMAIAIIGIGGVVAFLAIPLMWTFDDYVLARLANGAAGRAIGYDALAAISFGLAEAFCVAALSVFFLRTVISIIDSMQLGSPFIRENADRLRYLGWVVIAMQVINAFEIPIGFWLRSSLSNPRIFLPFSFAPLLVAMLLFVLARVFDHGVRLEEDAEGIV